MVDKDSRGHRKPIHHSEDDRKALGGRLRSARTLKGLTIDAIAGELTARGYPISKQAVGHWETGKNVPDAIWLKRLAKFYGTTLDALAWDEAISIEAIQFAVQYDALDDKQQRAFKAMWLAYFAAAKSDADVEQEMAATRPENRPQQKHESKAEEKSKDR